MVDHMKWPIVILTFASMHGVTVFHLLQLRFTHYASIMSDVKLKLCTYIFLCYCFLYPHVAHYTNIRIHYIKPSLFFKLWKLASGKNGQHNKHISRCVWFWQIHTTFLQPNFHWIEKRSTWSWTWFGVFWYYCMPVMWMGKQGNGRSMPWRGFYSHIFWSAGLLPYKSRHVSWLPLKKTINIG